MKLNLKHKILIFSASLILLVFVASQGILFTTKQLDNYFTFYKEKAVNGKIALLYIAKDMNYISRCSRDIMLNNDYDSNIQKIETAIKNIKTNFDTLEISIKDTKNEARKIDVFYEAKRSTIVFINDVFEKMQKLKNATKLEKYEMYEKYKVDSSPYAIQSRKYFKELGKIKDFGFSYLTDKFHADIKAQKDFISITTIFVIFALIIITILALKNILRHFRMEERLNKSNNLLEQYRQAIDITNIVSKTDPKGTITYVNDEFCKVSQYDKKELIGKPHNIIRSEDAPAKIFKELWDTIKSKNVWTGIVKNRKKDGSNYFVDTTILPILDNKQKIQEYIAIRKDITDIVELNMQLVNSQEEILTRMGMIAETRSKETGYHVKRVAEYCKIIASGIESMSDEEIELLYNASALHDIGKVGTPDHILHKPGKLTNEEYKAMQNHTKDGFDMLRDSNNEIVKAGSIIAYEHHEKFDGSGYPRGIKGKDIHIFARITAIADVFDALGENRTYKKAWNLPQIIDFMNDQKGKHFDPELIDIFNEKFDQILYIRKKFKNPIYDSYN